LAIGKCRIDARLHPGAVFDDASKHAELVGSAGDFAGESRKGERGFSVSALGKVVTAGLKSLGDTAQECSTSFAAGLGVAAESLGSKARGLIEFLRGCGAEDGLDRFAGVRREGLETGAVARAARGADEGESGEFHDNSSVEQLLATSFLLQVRLGRSTASSTKLCLRSSCFPTQAQMGAWMGHPWFVLGEHVKFATCGGD